MAAVVDKILKDAKRGDIPIEQSTTFEFVLNLRTAKTISHRFASLRNFAAIGAQRTSIKPHHQTRLIDTHSHYVAAVSLVTDVSAYWIARGRLPSGGAGGETYSAAFCLGHRRRVGQVGSQLRAQRALASIASGKA